LRQPKTKQANEPVGEAVQEQSEGVSQEALPQQCQRVMQDAIILRGVWPDRGQMKALIEGPHAAAPDGIASGPGLQNSQPEWAVDAL
jgi:hypothetical protein